MNNSMIIYYHSIAPQKNPFWVRNFLTLELKYFEDQLKYFVNNNFRFIDLNEYYLHKRSENIFNGKTVCITFDDGYADNYIYVYPLLKKYKAKATIFVNPVFVNKNKILRKTLEDYWKNNATLEEINNWGFLSWDEMRFMEKSGIVDIQSHTLTHTKYFVSDKITGFHYPGRDCLYPIGNLYTERMPYYIGNSEFEKLIPYGYPFFEERSSIVAKKVTVNPTFNQAIIEAFKHYDWSNPYNFTVLFERIKPIYEEYKGSNSIIDSFETEEEYRKRVHQELKESKVKIERELDKKVYFCCWPHGDNNDFAHQTALEIGYKATTAGKSDIPPDDPTRFSRIGLGQIRNSMFLTKLKTNYKVKSFHKIQPYLTIKNIYEFFRDLK